MKLRQNREDDGMIAVRKVTLKNQVIGFR